MSDLKAEVVLLSAVELQRLLRETWEAARREMQEPEVLTADECAKLLKVGPRTISNYVQDRGLPAHRLGQELRFRRSEVLAWLTKQTTEKGAA